MPSSSGKHREHDVGALRVGGTQAARRARERRLRDRALGTIVTTCFPALRNAEALASSASAVDDLDDGRRRIVRRRASPVRGSHRARAAIGSPSTASSCDTDHRARSEQHRSFADQLDDRRLDADTRTARRRAPRRHRLRARPAPRRRSSGSHARTDSPTELRRRRRTLRAARGPAARSALAGPPCRVPPSPRRARAALGGAPS